jgi:hypothetical protein
MKKHHLFFVSLGFLILSSCGIGRQSALGRKLFVQKEKPQKSIFFNAHENQQNEVTPPIQLNGLNNPPEIVVLRKDTSVLKSGPVLDLQPKIFNKNVSKQFKPLQIKKSFLQKTALHKIEKKYYEDVNDKKIRRYSLVGLIFSSIAFLSLQLIFLFFLLLFGTFVFLPFGLIFGLALIGLLFSINGLSKIKRKRKEEGGAYKKQMVMDIIGISLGSVVLFFLLLIVLLAF